MTLTFARWVRFQTDELPQAVMYEKLCKIVWVTQLLHRLGVGSCFGLSACRTSSGANLGSCRVVSWKPPFTDVSPPAPVHLPAGGQWRIGNVSPPPPAAAFTGVFAPKRSPSSQATASSSPSLPLLPAPLPLSCRRCRATGQLSCWRSPCFPPPRGIPWLSSQPFGTPLPGQSTLGVSSRGLLSCPLPRGWYVQSLRLFSPPQTTWRCLARSGCQDLSWEDQLSLEVCQYLPLLAIWEWHSLVQALCAFRRTSRRLLAQAVMFRGCGLLLSCIFPGALPGGLALSHGAT